MGYLIFALRLGIAGLLLVAGIHAAGRHQHLTTTPDRKLDALTRNLLGVGVRTDHLASPRDDEEN